MIDRYSRPRLKAIWEPARKYETWLKVERLACEALAKKGLIPPSAVKQIRARARIKPARIEALERVTKHDVIAFLESISEQVGPAARYLHMGLTSSDILDTSLAVLMVEAADARRLSDRAARPARRVSHRAGPGGQQHREVRHRNPPPAADGGAGSGGTLHAGTKGLLRHATQAQPDRLGEPLRLGSAGPCQQPGRPGEYCPLARTRHQPLVGRAGDHPRQHDPRGLHAGAVHGPHGRPCGVSRPDAAESRADRRRHLLPAPDAGAGAAGRPARAGLRGRPATGDGSLAGADAVPGPG